MKLKAVLLAMATASAFLFVAACGGGDDGGSNGGGGNGSGSGDSNSNSNGSAGGGGSSTNSTGASCQPQTIVGGDLFVSQQGPVGVTLLSNGGLGQYTFTFLYDNVFGIPTNNQQDKWGSITLFPPGTPVGTSTQVQLQPYMFVNGEQTPSTFPKGIPIELWLTTNDGNQPGPTNSSSNASIGKDLLGHDIWHSASVTYTTATTATVTFFSQVGGPAFSVGLTNVSGRASPTGC